ncbi:hypothetical protein RCC89_16830 [Cytophagaceae bacterium ABcell3]|nr:hypothetical protein RCC89_16830 [Cytophagaceae bacterium ABcell3]
MLIDLILRLKNNLALLGRKAQKRCGKGIYIREAADLKIFCYVKERFIACKAETVVLLKGSVFMSDVLFFFSLWLDSCYLLGSVKVDFAQMENSIA